MDRRYPIIIDCGSGPLDPEATYVVTVTETSMKHDWRNKRNVTRTGRVEVTIDLGYIVQRRAQTALRNKGRRAVILNGHAKAKALPPVRETIQNL